MNSIAHKTPDFLKRWAYWSRAVNIKEKLRYMRIKRLKRSGEQKKSTIPPAAWQEFIEI